METPNYSAITDTELLQHLQSGLAITEAVLMTAIKELEDFEGNDRQQEQRERLCSALELTFENYTGCVSELEQRFKLTIPSEF